MSVETNLRHTCKQYKNGKLPAPLFGKEHEYTVMGISSFGSPIASLNLKVHITTVWKQTKPLARVSWTLIPGQKNDEVVPAW